MKNSSLIFQIIRFSARVNRGLGRLCCVEVGVGGYLYTFPALKALFFFYIISRRSYLCVVMGTEIARRCSMICWYRRVVCALKIKKNM